MHLGFGFLHLGNGGAQRHAGREVEREGHRRQLADVRDAGWAEAAREFGDRAQWNQVGGSIGTGLRTGDVKLRQRGRLALELGFDFKDDPVFGHIRVNDGGLDFTVSLPERVFNLLHGHAQRGGLVAVNLDIDLRSGDQQIAGYILKAFGVLGQPGHQFGRPFKQFLHVGVLQAVLVKPLARHAAEPDERRRLHIGINARHLREFRTQFLDDFEGV